MYRVTMIVNGTSSFWYRDVEAGTPERAIELVNGMARFPSRLISVREL